MTVDDDSKLLSKSGENDSDIVREAAQQWTASSSDAQSESYFHAVSIVRRVVAQGHDRPNLVARIACEVGAEIIDNQLLPGEDLNSVDLAKKYKTSRTPVREALMLLENEGLVHIPPRRRPTVATFDLTEVREIYHLRSELLAIAASQVALRATGEEQDKIRQALEALCRAYEHNDLNKYLWANVEFHSQLTNIAHNKTAKRIIDSLLLRTIRLRRISLSQETRLERSVNNHSQLYEAFLDRDPDLASALIRSNHLQALAAVEAYLQSEEASKFVSAQ
ncbi:MAG: GntR family transcriptional regulator [Hyphomicrobiales bacterium]|nr:MAG: GntR family transcriptional regulator [Hyphomicrobiales bacterium]